LKKDIIIKRSLLFSGIMETPRLKTSNSEIKFRRLGWRVRYAEESEIESFNSTTNPIKKLCSPEAFFARNWTLLLYEDQYEIAYQFFSNLEPEIEEPEIEEPEIEEPEIEDSSGLLAEYDFS